MQQLPPQSNKSDGSINGNGNTELHGNGSGGNTLVYDPLVVASSTGGLVTHIPMGNYQQQQHPAIPIDQQSILMGTLRQHQQREPPRYPSLQHQPLMLRDFSQPPAGPPFDKCPIICSLFALLCCPITYCCSLPALLLSICSYTDYRVHDLPRFRSKSDCARRLIITACVVGLIVVIGWSLLTYIYRRSILEFLRLLITTSRRYGNQNSNSNSNSNSRGTQP